MEIFFHTGADFLLQIEVFSNRNRDFLSVFSCRWTSSLKKHEYLLSQRDEDLLSQRDEGPLQRGSHHSEMEVLSQRDEGHLSERWESGRSSLREGLLRDMEVSMRKMEIFSKRLRPPLRRRKIFSEMQVTSWRDEDLLSERERERERKISETRVLSQRWRSPQREMKICSQRDRGDLTNRWRSLLDRWRSPLREMEVPLWERCWTFWVILW